MYKVIHTNDTSWNDFLMTLPEDRRDIYYTREYAMLCEANGDGKGEMFIYQDEECVIIYPYLLNNIVSDKTDEVFYDIETFYGYGGPIGNTDFEEQYDSFRRAFDEYCKEKNIVCEFIRFHPLFDNANIKWEDIDVIENRTTVVVDLSKDIEFIWKNYISSKNRNMIRKAEKNALYVEERKDTDKFVEIYNTTMDKVNATSYYYFKQEYYEQLEQLNYTQLNVLKDDMVIAAGLFMEHGQYLHYHLAGSIKEYLNCAPNNLLLWEAIKFGKEKGLKWLHLGGGLNNTPEDRLFKFKKEFGSDYKTFYIGKCIHISSVYKKLIHDWEEKNQQQAKLFLQYRY